ncbi:MAG: carboxypeptidase regulatory-like domain-containing protein [Polyangiaceae bacterium]|nr:carboxypeptidase regulatory-like domain-containing protein [Polyangiaceae bacterium]MCW5790112.1 carboxypeptidase regulatory-like domain-containing protein [Polyangiaceae bacterium]
MPELGRRLARQQLTAQRTTLLGGGGGLSERGARRAAFFRTVTLSAAALGVALMSLAAPASARQAAPGAAPMVAPPTPQKTSGNAPPTGVSDVTPPAGTPPGAPIGITPAGAAPSAPPAAAQAAPDAPPDSRPSAPPGGSPPGGVPPGHPQVGGDTGLGFQARADRSQPSPSVPKQSIEAHILDADGRPLAGVEVRLGILRQTISTGESRESRTAVTDSAGVVRFPELPGADSSFAYRVTVQRGPGTFASAPFQLDREHGQQVLLHVYEVSQELADLQLGMFGFMFIETRDDVFAFEVLFRVFNIGRVAWVPKNVSLRLPEGWKAFRAEEGMSDVRFQAEDDRITLHGTFGPGQHEASFRFHVPNRGRSEQAFSIKLPPRVGQMQVIAGAPQGMDLSVQGFDPARTIPSRNGQRSLATTRRLGPSEAAIDRLEIRLSGIPTRGSGALIALVLSLLCVGVGLAFAFRKETNAASATARELKEADELILEELVRLTEAHHRGDIGPRTYERARQALLDASARLHTQLTA